LWGYCFKLRPIEKYCSPDFNLYVYKTSFGAVVYFILSQNLISPAHAIGTCSCCRAPHTGTRLVSTSGRKLSIAVPALLFQQRVQDLFAITRLDRSAPKRERERSTLLKWQFMTSRRPSLGGNTRGVMYSIYQMLLSHGVWCCPLFNMSQKCG
jgi:hypothetical protein